MANTSAKVRNRWNAKNYDRINLTVPKGTRDVIQDYVRRRGTTMNELANRLLREKLGFTQTEWGFASDYENGNEEDAG